MISMKTGKAGTAAEIKGLIRFCERISGTSACLDYLFCSSKMDHYQEMKNSFLLFEDGQLCSVGLLFAPGPREAEFMCVTLPERRRRGFASLLFSYACEEARRYGYADILLIESSELPAPFSLEQRYHAGYEYSEYLMRLTASAGDPGLDREDDGLTIRKASPEDIPMLAGINREIFSETEETSKLLMEKTVLSDDSLCYMAVHREAVIGMCAASRAEDQVFLYGLGILEEFRGRGFGSSMLKRVLAEYRGIEGVTVSLEVETKNEYALKLYTSAGMDRVSESRYYRYQL